MGTSMGRGSIMRREGCSNISLRSFILVHSQRLFFLVCHSSKLLFIICMDRIFHDARLSARIDMSLRHLGILTHTCSNPNL